jgi:hypothetical protein
MLLRRHHNRSEKYYNEIISLLRKFEPKSGVSDRKAPRYINMALIPEDSFMRRNVEYEKLVESLLNNQNDLPVAMTTALRGAGRYGKTTLSKAVHHDQRIIKKFYDGILWVTLGENPGNLIPYITDLVNYLGGKEDFGNLNSATTFMRDLIDERHLLIVIDDVWNSAHLEPFLMEGLTVPTLLPLEMTTLYLPKLQKLLWIRC